MQPSIRVTLLGGFAVTVNGVDCEVPEAASRLVALLALRPDQTFRVEIAAQLWPDRGIVRAVLRCVRRSAVCAPPRPPRSSRDPAAGCGLPRTSRSTPANWRRSIRRLNADRAVLRAFAEPERLTVELLPGWKDRRIQVERSVLRVRAT